MSSPSTIIAFLSNKLTLRGTEVALYDYADYNEKILGNKSIIITRDYNTIRNEFDVDAQAYQKFHSRFPVKYYNQRNAQQDIDQIVVKHKITHLFIEKSGANDGLISNRCKNLIHCVFTSNTPHGHVYSVLGKTVNDIFNTTCPIMPYMVTLPDTDETLHAELNIPKDAIVFGRYGGVESFDIKFVHNAIKRIMNTRANVFFIFMNTTPFYTHPNIIYLPGNADMVYKRKFVNTSDALIHARTGGETFGLTCGEFAICGKPVITWSGSKEREHLIILKDKAVIYNNESEVFDILNKFEKPQEPVENGYMFYTPENVMSIFNKLFIE